MSNYLAPATVTELLKAVIAASMQRAGLAINVASTRPDANGDGTPKVNVFLYQVVPNAAWRNADLPTRREDGTVTRRPQAALDLHYLLTFSGSDTPLIPERLLGSVTADLHARPLITKEMVSAALDNIDPTAGVEFLHETDLDTQSEAIRITPLSLDVEELSKLWSTFGETKYELSVAYKASVVLIEADVTPQRALPVRDRDIRVVSSQQPTIAEVASGEGQGEPILSGEALKIRGSNLLGEDGAIVRIGDVEEEVSRPEAKDAEITLAVPPELRAGVNTVCVSHRVLLGKPAVEHACFDSNVVPFVLCPQVDPPDPEGTDETFHIATGEELPVSFTPMVGKAQRVRLLLNEYKAPGTRSPYAYQFEAPEDNGITGSATETGSIGFVLAAVEPATYLVRAQVDGAFSALGFEEDESSPDFGRYNTPLIEVAEESP